MVRRSRYSVFVRLMRLLLPTTALALIIVVVLWPRLHGIDDLVGNADVDAIDLERDGRVRLEQPSYVGAAEDGGVFHVEADAARVDPVDPRRVELEGMRARMPAPGTRELALEAGEAIYDRDLETIELEGGIELQTSDGYRLRTDRATVELDAGTVATSSPVDGAGPGGTISADRLEVDGRQEVVRFRGNVKATLPAPGAGPAAGAPAP